MRKLVKTNIGADSVIFHIEIDNEIAGCIDIFHFKTYEDIITTCCDEEGPEEKCKKLFPTNECFEIRHVKVYSKFRNQGIANELMNEVMVYIDGGVKYAILRAYPFTIRDDPSEIILKNISLTSLTLFYEKFGFKVFGSDRMQNFMYYHTK